MFCRQIFAHGTEWDLAADWIAVEDKSTMSHEQQLVILLLALIQGNKVQLHIRRPLCSTCKTILYYIPLVISSISKPQVLCSSLNARCFAPSPMTLRCSLLRSVGAFRRCEDSGRSSSCLLRPPPRHWSGDVNGRELRWLHNIACMTELVAKDLVGLVTLGVVSLKQWLGVKRILWFPKALRRVEHRIVARGANV